jgi:magnesium-transporting ATPase (P-type)
VTLQGAVETLLERSTHVQLQDGPVVLLDEKSRKAILASLHELSTKALRCLGFAYKEDLGEFATYDGEFHPTHEVPQLYLSSSFLFCSWLFLVLFLILLASFCYFRS